MYKTLIVCARRLKNGSLCLVVQAIRHEVFGKGDGALYAGFGDTESDRSSYSSADIPENRNFWVTQVILL